MTDTTVRRTRIALDAMGGDAAPEVTLAGARAVRAQGAVDVVLVGPPEVVEGQGFECVAATEVVGMADKPTRAVRDKPRSSMQIAVELVQRGTVDGAVSAGNTGALMASALLTLGRLPGVERPAFGGLFPTRRGLVLLIDLGANADAKAPWLAQFAVMGSVYAQRLLHLDEPRVGLLNIGEEEGKGNQLSVQAYELLRRGPINFIGNVEGNDLPEGRADVVVCDGFTGNIVAKLAESMAGVFGGWIRDELRADPLSVVGALLARGAFGRLRRRMDYAEYGAAPLFGVNGLVVVAHGRSNSHAIERAITIAAAAAEQELIPALQKACAPPLGT